MRMDFYETTLPLKTRLSEISDIIITIIIKVIISTVTATDL